VAEQISTALRCKPNSSKLKVNGTQKEPFIRSKREAENSMAVQQKSEMATTNVVPFVKSKRPRVEPELKKFLDECVIPILVRQVLKEISLESPACGAPNSNCGNDSATPGVR
jgi:hypothetical protein